MKLVLAATLLFSAIPLERMAMSLFPQEKIDHVAGFFGPVTKKYLPAFDRFNDEYLAARDKMPVIKKYLPQAEAALEEARRMRVPPRYEAEKAQYIKTFEMLLASARFSVRVADKMGAVGKKVQK